MRGNSLGDVRAENDNLLESSFLETSDYKALLESNDRAIVVGRRGTGKSALVHMLSKHWHDKPKTIVYKISPEEEQIIGLRDIFDLFGDKYLHIKSGTKLAWRYAIYMEIITVMITHYKVKSHLDVRSIKHHLTDWGPLKQGIASKIRKKLKSIIKIESTPATRIAELSEYFEFDLLEEVIREAIVSSGTQFVIFADRLDEGYTPDDLGVAIVDGFIQSVIDVKSKFDERVIAFAFIRDNIYRAIASLDPDFTRNIEGQTIRLHWDEYNLFNLVCNRLRSAYGSTIENNTRVWNYYTAREMQGKDGFKIALKLTLYRPRDIIVLLNNAFLRANGQNRQQIIPDDIEVTAKNISTNRLNDLLKEYENVFPALDDFIKEFSGKPTQFKLSNAKEMITNVMAKPELERKKLQDIAFIDSPTQVLLRLYSVGFIGVYNDKSSSFVFCHDGREPDRDIDDTSRILVHPCYWLALGNTDIQITDEQADDIHDEYDIEISSISEEQRKQKIGSLLSDLQSIQTGTKGAHDFEDWAFKALKILFAGTLHNIELHPNKGGLQQRDVVATNLSSVPFWTRIFQDYSTRQVIFEIKNFENLESDNYRQLHTYLSNEYGRLAFIICRGHDNNLSKDKELYWAKELYDRQKVIVIKITSKFLEKHLSKCRNPQKHDAINGELNKLLDTYLRQYFINKCR